VGRGRWEAVPNSIFKDYISESLQIDLFAPSTLAPWHTWVFFVKTGKFVS